MKKRKRLVRNIPLKESTINKRLRRSMSRYRMTMMMKIRKTWKRTWTC